MRIGIIGSRGYGSNYGGVENACTELSSYLSTEMEVYIYGYERKKNLFSFLKSNPKNKLFVIQLDNFLKSHSINCFFSLLHLLFFNKPNVVLLFASGPSALAPICKLFGCKVICNLRAIDSKRDKWGFVNRTILKLGEFSSLYFSDFLTVNSMEMYELYKNRKKSIKFIPNGFTIPWKGNDIDISSFGLTKGHYILFAARLDPVKRLDVLIKAFNVYKSKNKNDFKLIVAGGECKSRRYYEYINSISNDDVILVGHLSKEQLDPLMRNCGLFVLPSILEGMSNSLLSAMSCKIPVLCSDIKCNYDVVESKLAVFKTDNHFDLAEKISLVFNDTKYKEDLVEHLYSHLIENFSWEKSSIQFRCVINSI